MKRTFIIFLFIIFSSSFSLANSNEKITLEDIRNVLEHDIPYFYKNPNQFEFKKVNENWDTFLRRTIEIHLNDLENADTSKIRKISSSLSIRCC